MVTIPFNKKQGGKVYGKKNLLLTLLVTVLIDLGMPVGNGLLTATLNPSHSRKTGDSQTTELTPARASA